MEYDYAEIKVRIVVTQTCIFVMKRSHVEKKDICQHVDQETRSFQCTVCIVPYFDRSITSPICLLEFLLWTKRVEVRSVFTI